MSQTNSIPILRVGDKLLVSIQVDLTDDLVIALQGDILATLEKQPARGILMDISALDTVDSYMGRMIADIGRQVAIMGARAVVTGIRPAVAIALIEMGISLGNVETALDIDSGIACLDRDSSDPRLADDDVQVGGET